MPVYFVFTVFLRTCLKIFCNILLLTVFLDKVKTKNITKKEIIVKTTIKEITKQIEDETYLSDMETIKYSEVSRSKAKLKQHAEKMVKEVAAALKHDSLMQVQLVLDGREPITFALETNIVNLPLSYYKKLINFYEEDEEVEVNVYFETMNEHLNASKFRIDLLAGGDEVVNNPEEVTEKLVTAMEEKFTQIKEGQKLAKEKAKEEKEAKKADKK